MAGLHPKLRGGVYHAVGSVAGERIRQSLGTGNEAQARELCAQLEARVWKRRSYGEEAVRTFAEAALSYMEAGGERTHLIPLIRLLGDRRLGSIKPEELRQIARKHGAHLADASKNRQFIVPSRAVINHAADLGWCPALRVKSFPVTKRIRGSASRGWLMAFVAQADRDGLPHLAAAAMFMWQNGARISEAAGVLAQHVNLKDRMILLARVKGGDASVRYITKELMLRLANLHMTPDAPVFGYASRFGIYQRMEAVCRRAGLSWIPPHQAGRHSFATEAFARGASIKEVMEGGGYKTARLLLETYTHAQQAGRSIADRFDADSGTNQTHSPDTSPQVSGNKHKA